MVVPTFDRAPVLPIALGSVLDQGFADLELIVVDDGSTDSTRDVVGAMGDDRIRLISTPRQGAAAARNAGIAAAAGELIAFQDSDDRWLPGKLAAQVDALDGADAQTAVVYGVMEGRRDGVHRLVPAPSEPRLSGDLRAILPRYNLIGTPSAVVRAAALRSVGGFDPTLRRFQDWDLWLRLAVDHRFLFVDQVVVEFEDTIGSITADGRAYFESLERLLGQHETLFRCAPEALVQYRLQLAAEALRRRHLFRAVGHGARAVKAGPIRVARSTGRRALGRPPLIHVTRAPSRPTRAPGD